MNTREQVGCGILRLAQVEISCGVTGMRLGAWHLTPMLDVKMASKVHASSTAQKALGRRSDAGSWW